MKKMTLKIDGMSCGHCVESVRKELGKIPGVTVEKVEIGAAAVDADEGKVTAEMLERAVEEAGYTVSEIA